MFEIVYMGKVKDLVTPREAKLQQFMENINVRDSCNWIKHIMASTVVKHTIALMMHSNEAIRS
jgi:hypothetical protein